ncbi:hypothetical protein [Clostridium saccharoperbutylacetonicum]|uniref:hypothetical protein n=1 Tax=Clostridium saccharoperbutylacetonicum TaxID=36745 RepID=UPI000983E7AF|nr:hypothetical protein [Clostridium saccharoperbutylacetonicum]AQR97831.1 hypothetical protein CLSAP_51640 [Clostridium saccharoperbutylacetonicum]NSB33723.1 hypothetical protein [Clostridium saccharoperbutylacetonicum]
MKSLVGYTGFVGSNLHMQYKFDGKYNSKNIREAYGTNPELLVYSGVRAEKFLANKNPEGDFELIEEAFENINRIKPKKLVLISTIDVYKNPIKVDEDTLIDTIDLHPYGYNRYKLEEMVRANFKDSLIIRLPGLYGKNIKKNFIYDLINVIPSMLTESKINELVKREPALIEYYIKHNNGFYKCRDLEEKEKYKLKECFREIGFSAMNFTDSRGCFQFYNLKYLWKHIQLAIENNINTLNLATEPITISELHEYITGKTFKNEVAEVIPNYNFESKYAKLIGGEKKYIFSKEFILEDIKNFVEEELR